MSTARNYRARALLAQLRTTDPKAPLAVGRGAESRIRLLPPEEPSCRCVTSSRFESGGGFAAMPIEDMSLLYLARTPPRRPDILRIDPHSRKADFISTRAASEI